MNRKLYWGLAALVILILTATMWVVLQNRAYIKQLEQEVVDAEERRKQRNLPNKDTVPVPPTEQAAPKGHLHVDGTFHEGEHVELIETPASSRDYTPAVVEMPEGITDPEVLAAWERLEYIANNIWDFGGVPSQETEELIAQLMPPPDGFSGPSGHSDAEETINLLGILDRNDPRSAEVLATYYCENIIGGLGPRNALAEIGPPAVPFLIPYLFESGNAEAVAALGEIAVKHRKDLGDIVDHIIIPKFEEYAAIEDPPGNMAFARYWAREALGRLK